MERTFFVLGSVFALVGVAAGAFGAHAMRGVIPADLAAVFETGVRYQLVHALALLAAAGAAARWPGRAPTAAGIVLFSGSLYLLSLTGVRMLGAVAPFGGVAFIAGWACLAWSAWSARSESAKLRP